MMAVGGGGYLIEAAVWVNPAATSAGLTRIFHQHMPNEPNQRDTPDSAALPPGCKSTYLFYPLPAGIFPIHLFVSSWGRLTRVSKNVKISKKRHLGVCRGPENVDFIDSTALDPGLRRGDGAFFDTLLMACLSILE
jgi:hypothetical protein